MIVWSQMNVRSTTKKNTSYTHTKKTFRSFFFPFLYFTYNLFLFFFILLFQRTTKNIQNDGTMIPYIYVPKRSILHRKCCYGRDSITVLPSKMILGWTAKYIRVIFLFSNKYKKKKMNWNARMENEMKKIEWKFIMHAKWLLRNK